MSEQDEILIKVGSKVIFEIIKETATGLTEFIDDSVKKSDIFRTAANSYIKHLKSHLDVFRILGMKQSGSINKIYVKQNLYDSLTQDEDRSYNSLNDVFDSEDRVIESDRKKIPFERIADKLNNLVILGKPGSGKTTLLKSVAIQNINGKWFKYPRIPIFISIGEFANSGLDLIQYVKEQFNLFLIKDREDLINELIKKGKCQLLLDGLDEVPDSLQNKVINEINDFYIKNNKNQIIISCRIGGYNNWFSSFSTVEIVDFDREQISHFIGNWFEDEEVSEKVEHHVLEKAQIRELASNPLLLALICIAYENQNKFPENRANIYDTAINVLIKKWDSSKAIDRSSVTRFAGSDQMIKILSKIGFDTFKQDTYFFPKEVLLSYFEDVQDTSIGDNSKLTFSQLELLEAVQVGHGLITARANNVYSFSHLTFQEYLTAKHIVDTFDEKRFIEFVSEVLYFRKWNEVITITAGLLPNADVFISSLQKAMGDILKTNRRLQLLLEYSQKICQIEDSNILEKTIGIIVLINLLRRKSSLFSRCKRELISFVEKLNYSYNYSIPDNFSKSYYSIYKREPLNYEYLIENLMDDLKVNRSIAHQISYVFKYENVNDEIIEDLTRYIGVDHIGYDQSTSQFFYLSSIYFDCLNSSPFLINFNLNELKERIFRI